jgi:cholesterol oxidase
MPHLGHFDVIVVGSGFGGSVMAYRLATADRPRRVLLLERGKRYPPGSFPRTPEQLRESFWDPSERLWGLADFWSFKGIEALVSSGLGGGSLIYANVMLRKDPTWFKEDLEDGGEQPWPIGYPELAPHYAAVETKLGVRPYPFRDATPKTIAMEAAALEQGRGAFQLAPLAVDFSANPNAPPEQIVEETPNLYGVPRYKCRLVGECDVGCNWGAKNTLDLTYLSEAAQAGARIETLHEVREIEPLEGVGYLVRFVRHRPSRDAREKDLREEGSATACRVVLAAGSLGSPFLLLRNCRRLGGLPPRIGTRFSSNGDLLTFAIRCVDADGKGVPLDPTFGPVITTATRFPDRLDGGRPGDRGFYLQDAGYPLFVAWMAELGSTPGRIRRAAKFLFEYLLQRLSGTPHPNLSAELSEIIGDAALSYSSLPLLAMGRDRASGTMSLNDKGYLELDWTAAESSDYFKRVRRDVKDFARKMGAEKFSDNPLWYFRRVVTVHPLGGCPMADVPANGAVSASDGEVFGHPGLHVADGSVMPSAIGPNPSLTIAAVSNRFADEILAQPRCPRP